MRSLPASRALQANGLIQLDARLSPRVQTVLLASTKGQQDRCHASSALLVSLRHRQQSVLHHAMRAQLVHIKTRLGRRRASTVAMDNT